MTGVYVAVLAVVMVGAPERTQFHEFGDLIVGEWTGEASLIEHANGGGEKVPAKLTYQWILKGRALEGEWRRGGVSGKWMLVWDPAAKLIRQAGARSDGNIWEGVIVKKGDEWIDETEGILGGGTKVSSRFVTVFQDSGKRLVWEGEFSLDGEKQEPIRDVYEKVEDEAHRVDHLKAGLDDSLWREFCKRRVGTWDGEGAIRTDLEEFGLVKGDPFVYSIEWVSEMEGRALTGVGKFEVPSRDKRFEVRLLGGWDPEMRQIRVIAVWSGGLVEELLFSHHKGGNFFGTYAAKFPGREPDREQIRVRYSDGNSSYAIEFLTGPLTGQPLSTWQRKE